MSSDTIEILELDLSMPLQQEEIISTSRTGTFILTFCLARVVQTSQIPVAQSTAEVRKQRNSKEVWLGIIAHTPRRR